MKQKSRFPAVNSSISIIMTDQFGFLDEITNGLVSGIG